VIAIKNPAAYTISSKKLLKEKAIESIENTNNRPIKIKIDVLNFLLELLNIITPKM